MSVVNGLFRLALDTTKEFEVHNLVIKAPDLVLTMPAARSQARKFRSQKPSNRPAAT